jgi:hypothetical protein
MGVKRKKKRFDNRPDILLGHIYSPFINHDLKTVTSTLVTGAGIA